MSQETLNNITAVFASIGTIIAAWFLIAKLIHPLIKRIVNIFNAWDSFIQDWSGTPETPGRSRVPGVMERINEIDGALKNNGGTSVKDAVDRIEKRINTIDERLEEGDKRFNKVYNHIAKIEYEIDFPPESLIQ
jgi:hypothetical protein